MTGGSAQNNSAQNNRTRYVLLALFVFPALVFQTKTTVELIRNWRTPPAAYRAPFSTRPGAPQHDDMTLVIARIR